MSEQRTRKRKLTVRWSKRENDFLIDFPSGPDGHLAHSAFFCKTCHPDFKELFGVSWDPSFADELKARGYDMKTLRFSIDLDEDKAYRMTTMPKTLDEVLADGRISLGACGRAVVRLPAPGTTGYLWSAVANGPIEASTDWDEHQRPPKDVKNLSIGSTPDVILFLKSIGKGEGAVTVTLKRLWEETALKSHVIPVETLNG